VNFAKNTFALMIDYMLILKGIAMGTANVIPGVSGGTIALITNIYERFINALKNINFTAIKLLFTGKIKELISYIDLYFLLQVFTGVLIAFFTIAFLLKYLFLHYPIYTWAFFFGLIIGSSWLIIKKLNKMTLWDWVLLLVGISIPVIMVFLKPINENDNLFYILFCGIIGTSGMVLPGISGSYLILLLGNYKLIMLDAVTTLNLRILIPFLIGSILGLIIVSYFISLLLKKYYNQVLSLLAGFVIGSLALIWPWKYSIDFTHGLLLQNKFGALIDANGQLINFKPYIIKYQYFLPEIDTQFWISIFLIIIGIIIVVGTEILSVQIVRKRQKKN
jgi:putative membrane protein